MRKSTLTPTDPCVLIVGLLAQPEEGLFRPDSSSGAAGLCLPTRRLEGETNLEN